MNTKRNKKVTKFKKLLNKNNALLKVVLLLVIVSGMMAFYNNKINNLNAIHDAILEEKEATIEKLNLLNNSNQSTIEALEAENKELADTANDLISTTNEINSQLKEAISANKSMKKEIKVYKEREELYNKYEYVIYDDSGNRTDITYDEIKYAEDLMNEKGYDPDLLFGIVMVESSATRNAKNSSSTATGYGQILAGTGKFVYEDLMNAGAYSHSYALDGKKNLNMTVTYLDYLIQNKDSLFSAVRQYCGRDVSGTYSYINRINSALDGANTFANISKSIN